MRDLTALKLIIEGEFNDIFLYGDELFLIDDDFLRIVSFNTLVHELSPPDPDDKVLFHYAFLQNDFFYRADSDFFAFFQMSFIRNHLEKRFRQMTKVEIPASFIERHTTALIPHSHPGVLHLEVYKSNVFLSDDLGTFSYRILNQKLLRKSHLLPFPALHMSALVGDRMFFSCGNNGLIVAELAGLRERAKKLDFSAHRKFEVSALSTETAYQDFIIRTVDDEFQYNFNALWSSEKSNFTEATPKDRVAAYHSKTVLDQEKNEVMAGAQFVSSTGNRLIKLQGDHCHLYKMNYLRRLGMGGGVQTISFEDNEDQFYELKHSMPCPINFHTKRAFSGFQTVFGLVLDTDEGTIALDDTPSFSEDAILEKRLISHGENVKVRHFYRSTKYSHIVASVKEGSVELYSDLTDYFFPKDQKRIRMLLPSGMNSGRRGAR